MDKNISIIKGQIDKLEDNDFDMKSWLLSTENFIKNIWGDDTPKSNQLRSICSTMKTSMFGYDQEDLESFKKQWKALLEGYVVELEQMEYKKTKKIQSSGNNINVTVTQNQSQEQKQEQKQTIDVEKIIEILKEELTGKQVKELDTILKEPESPKKIKKVIDKLLSFGSNVTGSILGNIITNPQIVGLL